MASNSRGAQVKIRLLFRGLTFQESMILRKPRKVFGLKLWPAALRIQGDYAFLITDQTPTTALMDYKERWQIETLFGCLKSRGFNLEDTHLQDRERISKLLGLITLAFCWSYALGDWLDEKQPIKIKSHGRKSKSVFRYGLDYLINVFFNLIHKQQELIFALKFLSRT